MIIVKPIVYGGPGKPEIRSLSAMAFDSVRKRVVLFGGLNDSGLVLGDTWEIDPSVNEWIQKQPISPAADRAQSVASYDPVTNLIYLFGGASDAAVLDDHIAYDGSTSQWSTLSPTAPPAGRKAHGMCYDSVRLVHVLFGGVNSTSTAVLADIHEFDSSTLTWSPITPSTTGIYETAPLARASHMMVYDAKRALTIVVGGENFAGSPFSQTWLWDGTGWRQQVSVLNPPSTQMSGAALAYVPALEKVILWGGSTTAGTNRTWALDVDGWQEIFSPTDQVLPVERDNTVAVADDRSMYVFGGAVLATSLNDLWAFNGNWAEKRSGFEFDDTLIEVSNGARLAAPISTADPSIVHGTGIQADDLVDFEETSTLTAPDSIRWAIEVSGQLKYHNGTNWIDADGTFGQTNTAEEIASNASTLLSGTGAPIRVVAFLHSDNGATTPELEQILVTYDFFKTVPAAPRRCTVFGSLEGVRRGTVVRALYPATGFSHGDHFIAGNTVFRTEIDSSGCFELSIPETETVSQVVTIEVLAMKRGSLQTETFSGKTIPNQDSVDLMDL